MTNLDRTEPNASLFGVPRNYTIEDAPVLLSSTKEQSNISSSIN